KLVGNKDKFGLDADHGFKVNKRHPGVDGTIISRVDHTYKGVRIFNSESVVVTDNAGNIVSESISDRRSNLGNGNSIKLNAKSFDIDPPLSANAVIDLVVKKVAQNRVHQVAPSAELVVYPIMETRRVASAANKTEAQLNALDLEDVVTGYELAY